MTLEPLPSIYSIESLEKWLRKFGPKDEVGKSCSALSCPVARWLKDEFGADPGISAVSVRVDHTVYSPDRWLGAFIAGIDENQGKITAAKALKILESVKKGNVE